LGSCGGGKIPQTRYYQLDLPVAPAPRSSSILPKTAVVMPWTSSEMLADDRIVYRPSREEVGYYEYHRWAEDPRSTISRLFIHSLETKGSFASIVPFDGRTRADYILRGRIDRLEEVDFEDGVKVYVELSAELLDASNSRVLWQGRGRGDGTVSTSDVRQVVSQMSQAAKTGVDQLTASLDQFLR
jgi:ABC-type uncharacterized transport system auxiliary subunit